MSVSVWTRARDGRLYCNPVYMVDEGFVVLDPEDPPELVLWHFAGQPRPTLADALVVLAFLFNVEQGSVTVQADFNATTVEETGEGQRLVPLSNPEAWIDSVWFSFDIVGRPPVPLISDANELYPGRIEGESLVYDADAGAFDHLQVEMPSSGGGGGPGNTTKPGLGPLGL